jgi:alpha-beta hydrolase superfamily lysophospholipase
MPVLDKSAKENDYIPFLANAGKRIDAAISLLKQKNIPHIILAAHSCGANMAINWLNRTGGKGIDAFIGMGMDEVPAIEKTGLPMLDVYGEKESTRIIETAPQRQGMMQKAGSSASKQMVLPEANHEFTNKGAELTAVISSWLNTLPL